MRKPQLKNLGPLVASCLVLIGIGVVVHEGLREPSHGGRTLSYWFNQLPLTFPSGGSRRESMKLESMDLEGRKYGSQSEKPAAAIEAVRAIGSKALPFLLQKLQRQQRPVTKWIQICASKCGMKRALFPNIEMERAQAVTALVSLSPLPPDTVARLHKLSDGRTNKVAFAAGYILVANTNSNLRRVIVPDQ